LGVILAKAGLLKCDSCLRRNDDAGEIFLLVIPAQAGEVFQQRSWSSQLLWRKAEWMTSFAVEELEVRFLPSQE
jgi:hypothetical protein